jgi:hypothetical protein
VNGQFAAVNDTLIGRFKKAMNIIKADFADFGQIFLGPSKDALSEIQHTIRRTLIQVTGTITAFGKGSMMDGLTSGFAKLADGFAKMINNYLPKAEGMMKGISSWWSDFRNGWNDVLDRTRPFIDAARVIENMIKNALQPLFSEFGSAMDNTRNLILNNKQAFEEFGTRVGAFITEFGRFAGATREIFVQALPFINDAVEGATKLFRIFNDVLNAVRQIAGVDSPAGAFGLAGGLMAAGRGMKKTIGGVVPDYAKMQKTQLMNVNAGVVNVDGQGGGMASRTGGGGGGIGGGGIAGGGGARSINGYPMAVNQLQARGLYGIPIPPGSQAGAMSPLRQQGMRSQVGIDNTGGGAPTGTGVTPAGGREIAPGYVSGPHNRGIYETASGKKLNMTNANWWKAMATPNTPGYAQSVDGVDPSRYKKFMGKYGPRAQRTTEAYARFTGDEAKGIKGFNNRASTGIGATLGLGLLSSIAPESAKGALALGSGVAMFNPGAGIAIGGLGAAATSTNSAFGAASGAMGGAAAGMMVGSVPGAIIGAVIGAIAGGIMGAVNKRKEEYRLARDAGRRLAETMQSQMFAGVSSAVGNAASQGAARTRTVVEGNLQSIISTTNGYISELQTDIRNASMDGGGQALKQKIYDNYTSASGIYGSMDQAQYEDALKKPKAAAEEMLGTFQRTASAASSIERVYDARMTAFQSMFGATQDEIFSMAQESGLNLLEVTMDFDSARRILISGLINDTQTLNSFVGETFATMYDLFDKSSKAAKAPLIYDEGARTIYDKAKANTLKDQDIQDFMGMATQQFPAMYGGGIGGLYAFRDQFYGYTDPRTGQKFDPTAFGLGPDGKPVPLTGQQPRFEATPGFNEAGIANQAALAKAGKELVQSSMANVGLGFTGDNNASLLMDIGGRMANLSAQEGAAAQSQLAKFNDQYNAATTDDERNAVRSALDTYLKNDLGPKLDLLFKTEEVDVKSGDTAALMADSVKQGIIDAFAPGFKLSANKVDILNVPYVGIPSANNVSITEAIADTRFPKSNSVGDTATNLSKTLDAHDRLNTGAGNRLITSSYRNYSLGSSNSDHVNGRAYDLVGDNLISYRDAVNRDGGFAQFHGDTQNRHLHVVPRIGDSMSPAYAMVTGVGSATSSQSSGAPVYNITVNGAGSNPEEIANMVMHKIKVNEKISKERSY